MSYPPPPQSPARPRGQPGRLRGRTQIRLGLFLGVPGLIALVIGIVVLATQSFTKVDGFQRVSFAQGAGTISFSSTGRYVAYYEAADVTSNISRIPPIALALRGPGGLTVPLAPYGNNSNGRLDRLTYSYNGHHGVAFREFNITTTGTYQVAVRGGTGVSPNGDVAFGESIEAGTIAGALLLVVGLGLFVAGIVLLIVGFVRRRRHKRELATASAYSYGAPPPGYPPAGYGPAAQQGTQQSPQQNPWQQPPPSLRKDDDGAPPWPPRE